MGIKCGTERMGDKMRHFNEIFRPFFYVSVFRFMFFVMHLIHLYQLKLSVRQ